MSIRIDANTDVVRRTTNLPSSANGPWTTALWFYLVANSGVNGTFAALTWTGGNTRLVVLTASLNLQLNSTGGTADVITTLSTGVWQYVAMRQAVGGTLTGFHWALDGTLTTGSMAVTATDPPTAIQYGALNSTNWADGRIAAMKFWDAALTDEEIANERFSILPRRLDGLNEFWPCFPGATERLAGYSKGRNFTAEGTLTDEAPPPIGWGASPIIVGAAAAAAASYELTDYGFFLPDGVGV